MTVDERIKKYFNTEWTFTDFFYAYCEAKGIDDPEGGDLTEEEYGALEKELEGKLTYGFLCGLQSVIMEDINERIASVMEGLAREG